MEANSTIYSKRYFNLLLEVHSWFFSPFQTENFLEQEVSYQQFVDNPAIIDDPNLVVKIGNKWVQLSRMKCVHFVKKTTTTSQTGILEREQIQNVEQSVEINKMELKSERLKVLHLAKKHIAFLS